MRSLPYVPFLSVLVSLVASTVELQAASIGAAKEDYVRSAMPPGFQVIVTELEGPVFADAGGRTLYKWPKKPLRNGNAGDTENESSCENKVYRENSGLMSPYPSGLEMPELDTRPTCIEIWPPVLAPADAKPIDKWTILTRPDGGRQWAYDRWPLYTSHLDMRPGDVLGGSAMFAYNEGGAQRVPVGPAPNIPSLFSVRTTMLGRLVTTRDSWSIYSYDGDGRNKSRCADECLNGWTPILAAEYARSVGEWTTFERSPGVKQWAFRGMPVYRRNDDLKTFSQDGSDFPGWRNVYTQKAPLPPKAFTMKDTMIGVVLGDSQGATVYRYVCMDDGVDQQECDHPGAPQIYRFTVCGGADPARCVRTFPYVVAPAGAKSGNTVWSTMYISPQTGKVAPAGQGDAVNVWAFRGRPVYTFAGVQGYGDRTSGDINGHAWGEFNGQRNGYKAMVYRDIYSNRDY